MARVKGFTVTLERDVKEEDFQRIKEAVEMIIGIEHVEPSIATSEDFIVRQRLRHEMSRNVLKAIDETK